MIYLTEEELKIVKEVLKKHLPAGTKVWVFGSRATGKRLKKFSDLDLAVDMGIPLSFGFAAALAEGFSESLLPYRVDIVDWTSAKPSFKRMVETDFIELRFT